MENKSNTIFRPKIMKELLESLKNGIKCEVVAASEEVTTIMLKGWLKFDNFIVYPSSNIGWVIYEPKEEN